MKDGSGVISNFLWKFSERVIAQFISLFVSIILARLLDPEHYGIVAIVNIFITLANVFISDGLGSALIQKKDADALDFSSVLYFSCVLSLVLYALLYNIAPAIASFYDNQYTQLVPVLRVMGISLVLAAISSVQQAYISKKMIFRKFFWATLYGTVISAVVGITMAYFGFGVWALVAQNLTNRVIDTIILSISLGKKPIPAFSIRRIKALFGFGSRILATRLLIQGYQELRAVLIAKIYSSADLAYYDKGRSFPNLLVVNINASISAVLFPKIASAQNDINEVKNRTRQAIRFGSYLLTPVMLGLFAVSDVFVRLILTERWLPCIPLMRAFCIIYLFQPIHTANAQAIKGIGKSNITFKLELFKKIVELISLIMVVRIGVMAIAVSLAVLTTLFTFVNAYPNIKLLRYSLKEQMMDISAPLCMGLVMMIVTMQVGKLYLPLFPKLILQVLTGGAVYILLSLMTHNQEYYFVLNYVKHLVRSKEKSV